MKNWWAKINTDILNRSVDEELDVMHRRERIAVFAVAYIIAVVLWFMVNLSRSFTINLPVVVNWGDVPKEKAPTSELPQTLDVSVVGEGWQLISFYNNPPAIYVDAREGEISLQELVLEQMNDYAQINATRVNPPTINVTLDEKIDKRVPVKHNVTVGFRDLYDFVGVPYLVPDSVTLTGAESLLKNVRNWETQELTLEDVRENLNQTVPLVEPGALLSLDQNEVRFRAAISEYTEGEVRVLLRARNVPENRSVSFSPTVITIKYDVPLTEFAQAQEIVPFRAYVSFEEIRADSSGFVSPTISNVSDTLHIRLRNYQPRRVAYYYTIKND